MTLLLINRSGSEFKFLGTTGRPHNCLMGVDHSLIALQRKHICLKNFLKFNSHGGDLGKEVRQYWDSIPQKHIKRWEAMNISKEPNERTTHIANQLCLLHVLSKIPTHHALHMIFWNKLSKNTLEGRPGGGDQLHLGSIKTWMKWPGQKWAGRRTLTWGQCEGDRENLSKGTRSEDVQHSKGRWRV